MSDKTIKVSDAAVVAAMVKSKSIGVKMLASDCEAILEAALSHCQQGEAFGYVSNSTYSATDAGTVRKTPNDVFSTPVFTHSMQESDKKDADSITISKELYSALSVIATLTEHSYLKLDQYNIHAPIAEVEWMREALPKLHELRLAYNIIENTAAINSIMQKAIDAALSTQSEKVEAGE